MQRQLLALTWANFDLAAALLAEQVPPFASGIYGVPRGGLPLAVALSHRTGLPLLKEPDGAMVWVDDIIDSARTLDAFKAQYPKAVFLAWASRGRLRGGATVARAVNKSDWVVFPWEDAARAHEEMRAYALSRQ